VIAITAYMKPLGIQVWRDHSSR